jgi:hypothetical protein
MSNQTHFLYRVDMWTTDGEKVIEHLAGIEDFQVAMATYRAACERWPGTAITLRQGARVIESPIRPRKECSPCPSVTQGTPLIYFNPF